MIATVLAIAITTVQPIESSDFLGFSADGRLGATMIRVAQARKGGWDVYTLVELTDVRRMRSKGIYRGSEIQRIDRTGKARPATKRATLLAQNPRYRKARPVAAWEKLAQSHTIEAAPIPLDFATLRLRPDSDSKLDGRNTVDALLVTGSPSSPVGYQVVVLTEDGAKQSIAHFRRPNPSDDVVRGEVRAYLARDRRSLAIVNTFAYRVGDSIRTVSSVELTRTEVKIAVKYPKQYDERGVMGMRDAFAKYVGDYGPVVPEHLRQPLQTDEYGLGKQEAREKYNSYIYMMGGHDFGG